MDDLHKKSRSRADAMIAKAEDWLQLRMGLYRKVNALPDDILRRLALVAEKLTPDELLLVLDHAEGLATWLAPEQESGDAPNATQGAQTGTRPGTR